MKQKKSVLFGKILPPVWLFFASLLPRTPLQAQELSLKLVSFNAMFLYDEIGDETAFPRGRIPRKEIDFERIRTHLQRIDPDWIALQEVENENAVRKILPNSYDCAVTRTRGYDQEIGVCWKKKFRPVFISERSEIAVFPGARKGLEIEFVVGNRRISVLNIHLKAGSDERSIRIRKEQLRALNRILREKRNFFLLGDFNIALAKDSASWKLLSEGVALKNPGRFTKPNCWGHKRRIDFILTDLPVAKNALESVPFPEDDGDFDGDPLSEKTLSDHCPIVLNYQIQGE
ncbi:endonuclease [Leptospira gomenensis]|uniref:Endonuclease n=1 Tax=Leptospira gomenensis TaxID=2484974 RepID=A0A5F1YA67_9LEPT|nr:endonuclease/exonuclease/phosphatase family protein [Leptospira gomenensis]TGK31795.1 endonuclease [Leptospira gomenensis]TGK34793.1 endonuclease [Leptospira gomenensis]TGK41577.1 endonuclease [Leptospira gomenensis]TGK61464.1 endonuclease [Leptospira gomenensis]